LQVLGRKQAQAKEAVRTVMEQNPGEEDTGKITAMANKLLIGK